MNQTETLLFLTRLLETIKKKQQILTIIVISNENWPLTNKREHGRVSIYRVIALWHIH
jgi:hypothetical protein